MIWRASVLTLFPEMFPGPLGHSLAGRALSAGIWSDKGAKIFWMAQRLRAGVVWGNTYNKFDPSSPFGGYKESGFGREGGRQGLSAYVELDA